MSAYAKKANEFYNKKDSHFVTLRERLSESLGDVFEPLLDLTIDEFKRRHKNFTKFADLSLCHAIMVAMDKILIDTTMQRKVNLQHIINIISCFQETMIMAIQVYEDPQKPGHYIAWDGQHTAIVLYVLATKVFGERVANLMVPVVIYSVKQKAEIRRNFILLNGDAKSPLDMIDIFRQMVSGVRIDGSDDPLWKKAELKQQYLEKAGIFVTNEKFGDEDEDGAFSLLSETLMSTSEKKLKSPDVTRMFSEYWVLINQQRPVDSKEARQLYEFFHACEQSGIDVNIDYLKKFAQFTKDYFSADFSASGPFWDKVKIAYNNWYRTTNPQGELDEKTGLVKIKGFKKEWKCGGPFLIAQLKKSTDLQLPKFESDIDFIPNKTDLW
jgi:hypothetical protein